MSKRVHFHFQFTATFRQETKRGIDFLVVPGIIIQEQVLNYYFVPGDEINAFHEAWNDRPITIRHPETINGSAGWVDLEVIGRIYNARFDESSKQLHAEFWFEQRALAASADGRLIEANIRSGQVMEVSTGYWANEEFVDGTWDGVPYFAIHHDLRPDHVAVLVDQIGACSVEDGCGMPRVNCAQCESDQVLVANFKKPKVAKKGIQIMTIFGKKKKAAAKKPVTSKVKITDPAVLAMLTALNVSAELVEGTTDEYVLTNENAAEPEEPKTNDDEPEPQRDPFAVELEAALEPIGGAEGFAELLVNLQGVVDSFKTTNQNEQTLKEKLIKKLTKNKAYPLSAEALQKLTLAEVQGLVTNQEALGIDFSSLGAVDLVALNAGDEDEDADEDDADEVKANSEKKLRQNRGIGLAGTLGQKIDLSLNGRRARGGVR